MPTARAVSPARHRRGPVRPLAAAAEALERRAMLAVHVQVDYSLDANGFFNDPLRRTLLERAADEATERLGDRLDAIEPGGSNSWTAIIDNPATGRNRDVANLVVPADTIIIYAGGRDMSALGVGGPGGFNAEGSSNWQARVRSRGQGDTEGGDAGDFGPWGGSVSFDLSPSGGWYFGTEPTVPPNNTDFYSVALHEVMHVLGFGTAPSWDALASDDDTGTFSGAASVAEYDGDADAVPLNPVQRRPSPQPDIPADLAHWKSDTEDGDDEAAMDPELTSGRRKELTALDLAGLDDLGWEIPLTARLAAPADVTTAGAAELTFAVEYGHYTAIDAATVDDTDLTVSGPGGFSAAASLVGVTGGGRRLTATYAFAAPGGTFDRPDSGTYTVALTDGAVGDRFDNYAPAGTLATFNVDIESPPVATLAPVEPPRVGAASAAMTVTYLDVQGVDPASIDVADIAVLRAGHAEPLMVSAVSFEPGGSGGTATYTVDAPGGTWDPGDNGTYEVVLGAGQVRDPGNAATDAVALGTFDVSLGTVDFAQGRDATYFDAGGDAVTVSLRGPGAGQLVFDAPDGATTGGDASRLILTGTTGGTTLTITAAGGGTSFGGLTTDGPLKSITGRAADLAGTMTLAGAVPRILLRNATGSIALGDGGAPATIQLAQARDLNLTTAGAIKSLKVGEWLDTDATPDVIRTPSLTALAAAGTFQAHVEAGSVGKLTVGGALSGAEIRAAGSIGSVVVGSAADSLVYAGVRPDVTALPDSLDDFSNPAASIKSVTLKGKTAVFSNTRIAAPFVAKAALGAATIGTTAGDYFGLAADRFTSVSGATSVKGPYKLAKRQDPGSGTALIDFAIVVL